MANYPKDQFDDFPEDLGRVGAHRGPRKRGGGWIGFAWAALATGVLIVGGLYAVTLVDDSIEFLPGATAAASATPKPTVIPTADPVTSKKEIRQLNSKRKITITLLNGTATEGIENTASKALKKLKWPVTSATSSSATDITKTTVYYRSSKNEDVARGLSLALKTGNVKQSTVYEAPITVVLGSDYADLQE